MKDVLGSLLLWFYCLDLPDVGLITLAVTALFLLLHGLFEGNGWWLHSVEIMLICWVLIVACATVLVRNSSDAFQHSLVPFHSYQEVWNSGNREIYRSNFWNAVLFYPAGLLSVSLLTKRWPEWCRCLLVVLVLTAMSSGIEFLQCRYALGRCETDDVIHNTLGALLGSLAALWGPSVLMLLREKLKLE